MLAGFLTDVSETVEEGETLKESRSSDDVGNAIATGILIQRMPTTIKFVSSL